MHEYKFQPTKVLSGDTVCGSIDLGFGIHLRSKIKLAGIDAPSPKLDKSILDLKDRLSQKNRGVDARKRLQDLLTFGKKQPDGLIVQTYTHGEDNSCTILGRIKYIYARDLYNAQPNESPWTGWKCISEQLLNEGLVDSHL